MRANIDLKLNPSERSALRMLTSEEREAVVEEMLAQVRRDLQEVLASELGRTAVRPPPVPPLAARRSAAPSVLGGYRWPSQPRR